MKKLPFTIDDKHFDSSTVESFIREFWQEEKLFETNSNLDKNKNVFSIILPPPNANARLHLGHVSGYAYQDLMGRFHRLLGDDVLLLPGKDHGGIQTEVVFEKELSKQNIRKRDLSRDEFFKRCYEFSIMNMKNAREQEEMIGLSADFSKDIFTLDDRIKKTVYDTFVSMYKDGLIYRGKRIINWCTRCLSALADVDTENKDEDSFLYYIKYGDDLVVATTRPETKIADTALAVNPRDERYKKYINTEIEVVSPEGTYMLPVIAEDDVDMNFGTGVLKITPGHSPEDYKIGLRHNLPIKTVIDKYGKMNESSNQYKGLKVIEARNKIVEDLKKMGLLVKIEAINHSVPVCERCKTIIEPLISYQWFLSLDELKRKTILAIENEDIKIHPKRMGKNLIQWLVSPEDWCLSRQLFWGFKIPAYYCGGKDIISDENGNLIEKYGGSGGCGEIIVQENVPDKCPKCGGTNIVAEEDILDTWFSSTQWPYATLLSYPGYFEKYFPTSVMETGRDIIFFWVARMIIMGIYKYGEVPFKDVHLHGLVTDKEGKKMSKSKGNGIDPFEMIQKYGVDALRYSFVFANSIGKDYRLFDEKIKGNRNFVNKIWNASRFILQNISDEGNIKVATNESNLSPIVKNNEDYIKFSEFENRIIELNKKYKFGKASEEMYEYFWHTYCDVLIEKYKEKIKEKDIEAMEVLLTILVSFMQLLHPYMPYITEYIWILLYEKNIVTENSISKTKFFNIS